MSLMPAFEIGLWNAWIFALPFLLIFYGLGRLIVGKEKTLFMWPEYTKKERVFLSILMVCMFSPLIYSIFLPLKLNTAWFYAGFAIYLVGMIFVITAQFNFAMTPPDKPVTKGIYRISRNPIDFGFSLIFISIGIACASWVVLIVTMVLMILMRAEEVVEERMCLERFGNPYKEYMDKTPKWIGIPKLEENN